MSNRKQVAWSIIICFFLAPIVCLLNLDAFPAGDAREVVVRLSLIVLSFYVIAAFVWACMELAE